MQTTVVVRSDSIRVDDVHLARVPTNSGATCWGVSNTNRLPERCKKAVKAGTVQPRFLGDKKIQKDGRKLVVPGQWIWFCLDQYCVRNHWTAVVSRPPDAANVPPEGQFFPVARDCDVSQKELVDLTQKGFLVQTETKLMTVAAGKHCTFEPWLWFV